MSEEPDSFRALCINLKSNLAPFSLFEKLSDNIKNNNKEFTELKSENYQLIVISNSINKNIERLLIINKNQLEILNSNNQKLIENIADLVNKLWQAK